MWGCCWVQIHGWCPTHWRPLEVVPCQQGRVHVTLLDTHPFLIVGNNGQEIPTTRVTVSDIPLSYNNADFEAALKKLGCQLVSPTRYECNRDNGKLTRWKTGRRFLFIGVPKEPLPREVKIGLFTAKLYHREQGREQRKQFQTCNNCLQKGHYQYECNNPVVCRVCRRQGHRQGHPDCTLLAVAEEEVLRAEEEALRAEEVARAPEQLMGEQPAASQPQAASSASTATPDPAENLAPEAAPTDGPLALAASPDGPLALAAFPALEPQPELERLHRWPRYPSHRSLWPCPRIHHQAARVLRAQLQWSQQPHPSTARRRRKEPRRPSPQCFTGNAP